MASAVFAAIAQAVVTIASGGQFLFLGRSGYIAFAGWTATYAALGAVSRALFGQAELDTTQGVNFNVRDPASTRKIIYGKCRIGGTIVFINTSDTDNNYLHLVIAVAGHEIEGYEEVYFDEEKVWESGSYLNDWDDHCLLKFKDGTQTTADTDLVNAATGFTSAHILEGTAYVYARLDYDREKFTSGVPNISFVVKGKKVYDPRTTTTVWSDNPALILNDYLLDTKYGLGESSSNIDQTALTAAANVCDENITLLSGTQKNYTCDGILDTGTTIKANVENILSSMIGTMHYTNGKFHIMPFDDRTPETDKITDDILVAPISITTKRSRSSLYNTVKGRFVSEEMNYIVADYPEQTTSGDTDDYTVNDGETISLDLNLPMTTNQARAQRLAKLTMEKSRMQMTISMQLNMQGLKYKVGDNVNIVNSRFGWTNASPKRFEITNISIIPDPERGIVVQVEATENETSVYDWTASQDQQDYVIPPDIGVYTGTTVVAPTNLKVYSTGEKASKFEKLVKVKWDGVELADGASPYEPYFSHYEIIVDKPLGKDKTYTTTDDEIVVTITTIQTRGATKGSGISVRAVNTRGYKSTSAGLANLKASTVYPSEPENINNVVSATYSSPSVPQLTELAHEAGIIVQEGTEITYIQVNSSGVALNSREYVFESTAIRAIRFGNVDPEVDRVDPPELVTNGTFSTDSDWVKVNTVGTFTIASGVLTGTDVGTNDFLYQVIESETGLKECTYSKTTSGTNGTVGLQIYDANDFSFLATSYESASGTHSFSFYGGDFIIVVVGFAGTGSLAVYDNFSVKDKADAIDKIRFTVPKAVSNVTFTHAETNKAGVPATGVTETYTGFTGTNLTNADGEPYVEVSLERASTEVGLSQLTTEVTATWTETQIISGVTENVVKTATRKMTLTARVL